MRRLFSSIIIIVFAFLPLLVQKSAAQSVSDGTYAVVGMPDSVRQMIDSLGLSDVDMDAIKERMMISSRITGCAVDAQTGDSIPYVSAIYKGNHVMSSGDAFGLFSIERHEGWYLTISAIGYVPQTIMVDKDTPEDLRLKLRPTTQHLKEVVVKTKRRKYSRKNNPAVELMKRVIAAKKKTALDNHDFYQYDRYQKVTTSLNDLTPQDLEAGMFKKYKWMKDYVEVNEMNNKLTLALMLNEKVTHHIYRKDPKSKKTIVKGLSSTGLTQFFDGGNVYDAMMQDVFTDIDIYDDQIRLFQYPFTSPIGKDAISFYRFYIVDTVKVENDSCYHLQFIPNNQQDFGFRGEIFILKDSTLHVRRCNLTIPKKSDVNFVDNMQVKIEYEKLPNGEWVTTVNDMFVELKLYDFLAKGLVVKTMRQMNYDFSEIPEHQFKGKKEEKVEANAQQQPDNFWNQYRKVELTKGESSLTGFLSKMEQVKGFKYIIYGLKLLFQNYAETGKPSKIDIGPINTMISHNAVDGLRTRFSLMTTAHLSKHWYAVGYFARGWKSKNNYYLGELTYSFNEKEYLPREFPKRTITLTSNRDVMLPSDKYLWTDKDNVFESFKWAEQDKMILYNRQQLAFEWEEEWGFKTTVSMKTESNVALGNHCYYSLADLASTGGTFTPTEEWGRNGKIRTTELYAQLRLAPGEKFVNTKLRRKKVNYDSPVITLSHTLGVKGFLGGQYNYNYTQFGIYKRFWLNSWGHIDFDMKTGYMWNKVPYPLLIMPAANLSYIMYDQMFNLINNMEFINDRYASFDVYWDINGKIFNRIPGLRHLKLREAVGVRCLWGALSDKNNPNLEINQNDLMLMPLPTGCNVMDGKRPYFEIHFGVHNIFRFIHVEYVRRLNYLDLPTATKHGIRFFIEPSF